MHTQRETNIMGPFLLLSLLVNAPVMNTHAEGDVFLSPIILTCPTRGCTALRVEASGAAVERHFQRVAEADGRVGGDACDGSGAHSQHTHGLWYGADV
ncbi:hypothetical protein STCU_11525 [Strigomonas culicis]|uniref:Uncharacterized protein n=1 Tax=Strigomonas culicis TaxID=28005 RepID=S9UNB0_9TRYP|nr:hypothetical protein STCU_11525 [Strigomonas culicis]|eukprot:EPY16146.1 hypothetical protein STCU_11525 [Strigomonas culicis]